MAKAETKMSVNCSNWFLHGPMKNSCQKLGGAETRVPCLEEMMKTADGRLTWDILLPLISNRKGKRKTNQKKRNTKKQQKMKFYFPSQKQLCTQHASILSYNRFINDTWSAKATKLIG